MKIITLRSHEASSSMTMARSVVRVSFSGRNYLSLESIKVLQSDLLYALFNSPIKLPVDLRHFSLFDSRTAISISFLLNLNYFAGLMGIMML